MSEFIQELGFDASGALATLRTLDSAFATLETRLQSSARTFTVFNQNAGRTVAALRAIQANASSALSALSSVGNFQGGGGGVGQITQSANSAAAAIQQLTATANQAAASVTAAMSRIGRTGGSNLNQGAVATQRLTTSLALLSRIVFTQFILSQLRILRTALVSTAGQAVEFQRQLALVRTIDDSGRSIEQLGIGVRDLSDQFNIPLIETAAGLYQTISNQIGNAAQSTEFLAQAAQFAKATNSSLSDSVDLVSGAMKSYNLEVEDANKVTSLFFTTIDKGRVTADELANAVGRVLPVAAEMGVTLEEAGAAIAAISVKGSKTPETLTQLRNILTALQKPTPAMTQALRDLGFSSSETAIRTLGLDGVLRELAKSANGSNEQLARLFPNVRGLNGVTALTADNLETLTTNLTTMKNAARDFSREKFLQATATDAEAVTKEINKLRNALTVDLGQSILSTARSLSNLIGGAEQVIDVAGALGPAIVGLGGTFLLFRGQALAAAGGVGALSTALGALSLIPLAAGVGSSIGQFLDTKLFESSQEAIKKLEEAGKTELESFKKAQAEKRDAASKADQDILQSRLNALREINKSYLAETATAVSSNKALVANTKAALDQIVDTRTKLVEELSRAADESRDIIKSSNERISNLQIKGEDRQFDLKIGGLDDAQRMFLLAQRAQDLASKAADQLSSATDQSTVDRALQTFNRAQGVADEAAAIASRTKDRGLEVQAARQLESISTKQIAAEQQLQALQKQRQTNLDAERKKQQEIVNQLREQAKIVLDNTGTLDNKGQPLSSTALANRQKTRQDALKQIASQALSQKDLDASKVLGITDFVSRFQNELSRDPVQLSFTVENETTRIQNQLQQAFSNFKLKLTFDTGGLGEFSSPDQLAQRLQEQVAERGKSRIETDRSNATQFEQGQARAQVQQIIQGLQQADELKQRLEANPSAENAFQQLVTQIQKVGSQTNITDGDIQRLLSGVRAINEVVQSSPLNTRLAFADDVVKASQAIGKLNDIKNAASGAKEFADQMERGRINAEAAAAAVKQIPTGGEAVGRSQGGPMHYFLNGGLARGLDKIPAMLRQGEFVVEPKAARAFSTQLTAMNAGIQPVFRSDGGSVTNVGDINVNVTGGNNGRQTARSIATELRREISRRKTFSL